MRTQAKDQDQFKQSIETSSDSFRTTFKSGFDRVNSEVRILCEELHAKIDKVDKEWNNIEANDKKKRLLTLTMNSIDDFHRNNKKINLEASTVH